MSIAAAVSGGDGLRSTIVMREGFGVLWAR